jgi:hypothetical protein
MARTRFADGGDGFQLWNLAVTILNKQSWTAYKEWSSSLGVGRGAKQLLIIKDQIERNFKWILGKQGGKVWTGCIRRRIGTSGGL